MFIYSSSLYITFFGLLCSLLLELCILWLNKCFNQFLQHKQSRALSQHKESLRSKLNSPAVCENQLPPTAPPLDNYPPSAPPLDNYPRRTAYKDVRRLTDHSSPYTVKGFICAFIVFYFITALEISHFYSLQIYAINSPQQEYL